MNFRRWLLLQFIFLASCQGPVKLTDNWEVGEISADATYVFGATLDGIRRVGRDGGSASILVAYRTGVFEESQYRPGRIAVDENYVYWTQNGAPPGIDAVRRVRKTGGKEESVIKIRNVLQSQPIQLQVDESSVYVLTYGRGPFGNSVLDTAAGYEGGCLLRANKNDGSITELATRVKAGSGLTIDQDYVYWSEGGSFRRTTSGIADHIYNMDGKILRISKRGGVAETIASNLDNPYELRSYNGKLRFRTGKHYEKNNWTPDLGFFEIGPSGGTVKNIGNIPYFAKKDSKYFLRTQYYGPIGKYGQSAHYFLEREDMDGKIFCLYKTDDNITSLIMDRNELLWLQGTSYSLMKMKLP